MTVAWYGHLRFRGVALWKVVLVSWGIAFFEYCLQVPANRLGYGEFTAFQLKIIQEVITLIVFVIFAVVWVGGGGRGVELRGRLRPLSGRGIFRIPAGHEPRLSSTESLKAALAMV